MLRPGKRISSSNTFVLKRIFPVIWFGVPTVLLVVTVTTWRTTPSTPVIVFVMPVLVCGIGFFVMRRLVFDLADEVVDEGDALRVRFGHEEERIPLADIMNVSYAGMTSPPRVTLTLRSPCRFGREVTFSPPRTFLGSLAGSNPLVKELIERVDAARRR